VRSSTQYYVWRDRYVFDTINHALLSATPNVRLSGEKKMAFNNLGPIANLAAGQAFNWFYTFGADRGTQMATADIKTPNSGSVHLADNQRKRKDNNGNATYFVRIVNQGPGSCFHNLQGGGMA
jgi:hypothetical protein